MYGSSKAAPPYWKNDCEQMDNCGIYHRICNSGGPNSTDQCSNRRERYVLKLSGTIPIIMLTFVTLELNSYMIYSSIRGDCRNTSHRSAILYTIWHFGSPSFRSPTCLFWFTCWIFAKHKLIFEFLYFTHIRWNCTPKLSVCWRQIFVMPQVFFFLFSV